MCCGFVYKIWSGFRRTPLLACAGALKVCAEDPGVRLIVFARSNEQCKFMEACLAELVKEWDFAGGPQPEIPRVEGLPGMSALQREQLLEDWQRRFKGKPAILLNCAALAVGFDLPCLSASRTISIGGYFP